MAALPSLIKFRLLADQLRGIEFFEFLTALINKCGRNVIISALFLGFSRSNNCKFNPRLLNTIIEIMEDIIRAREQKTQTTENFPLSMQSLSSPLIGEIASFCHLEDNIDYSCCSRAIYHGCNSPNTLRKLDLKNVPNYSSIDLTRFPRLEILAFHLSKFHDLPLPHDRRVCRHLKKIVISNEGKIDADIDSLLNCDAIPFDQITHLSMENYGESGQNVFPKMKLLDIISVFPKTTYLGLRDVYTESITPTDEAMLYRVLPNLNIFCDRGTNMNFQKVYRKPLKALQLFNGHQVPSECQLDSLEEVDIGSPLDGAATDMIRQRCRKLKRISLDMDESSVLESDITAVKQLIFEFLSKQEYLRQLVVTAPISKIDVICAAMERGVFRIADAVKSRLELKLVVLADEEQSVEIFDILIQISRVINNLHAGNISDFVFMWRFGYDGYDWDDNNLPALEDWKREMSKFANRNESRFEIKYSRRNILISNKGCALSGCIQNYVWDGWLIDDMWTES